MVLTLFGRDAYCRSGDRVGDYLVEKTIGEGRYAICYQVSRNERRYVLKHLKKGMYRKSAEKARFEEEILRSLHHPSIPRFIERIQYADFCGYVLEFKEGRTFEDIIYLDGHTFDRNEICGIGTQLIGILKYLHETGIVHRDIRVPNTVYDGAMTGLIDFGLARWANGSKYRTDMDFAYLGDFLLHLYYTTFDYKGGRKRPWYHELPLSDEELLLLKRLMGIEKKYEDIAEVEADFFAAFDRFDSSTLVEDSASLRDNPKPESGYSWVFRVPVYFRDFRT